MVVTTLEVIWCNLYNTNKNSSPVKRRFNTQKLVHCKETALKYQTELSESIIKSRSKGIRSIEKLKDSIREIAEKHIGYKEVTKNRQVDDEEVNRLSKEQKCLRLAIQNSEDPKKIEKLKSERKQILKTMEKRIKKLKGEEIDRLVNEIEKAKDDKKMFKAVPNTNRKTVQNQFVYNKEGQCVTKPEDIHKIIETHFKEHFQKEGLVPVEMFEGEGRKLNKELTTLDVKKAVITMSNNRAPGKDNISAELFKYARNIVHEEIAIIINKVFENHTYIDIGYGILIPLSKPNKIKGPVNPFMSEEFSKMK